MIKVLACVDGGPQTPGVCDYAAWAALRLAAPLEFLHVLDRHPERALIADFSGSIGMGTQESLLHELAELDEKQSQLAQEHGWQILEIAKQRATSAGVPVPDARQRHGSLIDSLLELEETTRLVVIGQRPQPGAVPRLHLDQNVERVVRTLHKPVLVATSQFKAPARCAIAFDGSATGRRLVEMLAGSPLLQGMPCHIVMAGEATSSQKEQLDWASNKLQEAGFSIQVVHRPGNAENILHETIVDHHIDLLVMGAYGHTRIREFIVGSTTTTMLRTSPIPVLILR